MVQTQRKRLGAPPPPAGATDLGRGFTATSENSGKLVNLNFKIDEDLHKALKVEAACRGWELKQLLVEMVKLWERENGLYKPGEPVRR